MVKHSRFAKTAKVFPLERFDVYGTLNAENIPDPSCMQGRIQGGVFGVSRPPEIYQRSQNTLKCTISCHFSTLCNKTTYIFQGVAPINNKVIIVD